MKSREHTRDDSMAREIRGLLDLARDWFRQGNTTVAMDLLRDAQESNPKDHTLQADILKEMGRIHTQNGHWDRAEDACRRAAAIFLEKRSYRGAAESIRNLANMKFQLGQFDESYELCDEAIGWATRSGNFQLRATILNTQAAIKSMEGEPAEAVKIFQLCLSDFRRAGNGLRQAYILHNIGLASIEIGDYDKARTVLEEATHLALENKDTNLVQLCYQNSAKLHLKLGDIIAARSLIKTARTLLETLNSPHTGADLDIIEADSYKMSGDPVKASEILTAALHLARESNLLQHEAEILYELGQLAIEQGQIEQARYRLEAAVTLLRKTGAAPLKMAIEKLKNLEETAKKAIRV
jgi:tetratricopeptide (TPR) repeat protein